MSILLFVVILQHQRDLLTAVDELPGVIPGDIVFTLQSRPSDGFERDGDDLLYKVASHLIYISFIVYNLIIWTFI